MSGRSRRSAWTMALAQRLVDDELAVGAAEVLARGEAHHLGRGGLLGGADRDRIVEVAAAAPPVRADE